MKNALAETRRNISFIHVMHMNQNTTTYQGPKGLPRSIIIYIWKYVCLFSFIGPCASGTPEERFLDVLSGVHTVYVLFMYVYEEKGLLFHYQRFYSQFFSNYYRTYEKGISTAINVHTPKKHFLNF
jgi:hypothetical protein